MQLGNLPKNFADSCRHNMVGTYCGGNEWHNDITASLPMLPHVN